MNLNLTEAVVASRCAKAGVSVSAIETLASGGTHLVCTTGDGAEQMRDVFKKNIIKGRVKRFAFAHLPSSDA